MLTGRVNKEPIKNKIK